MINIIGAGPSGSHLACLLANAGREVQVFEEHTIIGKPVQCTGIVTSEFKDIMEPKREFVINKINRAKIFSISGKCIDIKSKKPNYILDRHKFDSYLAEKAEEAGAKFFLKSKFISGNNRSIVIKKGHNKIKMKKGMLIGADGPLSSVSRCYGMNKKKGVGLGFQYRIKMENSNAIEFYPGVGIYAWVVPEGNGICRVGMGDYFGGNIKEKLDIFIRKKGIRKKDIINSQGGLIPVYDHFMQIQKDNVFLIGDAAAQVKASTGGGIVPGLIAAEGLKNAIIKKKDYKNQIKKLRKELLIHRVVRHMLDNFKNEDWRYLFKLFENKKNKEILASIERENISRLVDPLLKNDPRFLFFIRKIFF